MLSPKNILSINNLEAQDKPTRKTHCYYKMFRVLSHGRGEKRLGPECTISYQDYLLISKCTNNCNIIVINHLGLWS